MAAKGGPIRMSAEDVAAHQARVVASAKAKISASPKRDAYPATTSVKQTATQRMQALGRLPKGVQNKSEKKYDDYLAAQKALGNILWYRFEGIKLMIAPNTSITIDFAVLRADNVLEMRDLKGSKGMVTDDFRAKCKVAASLYPFVFKVAYPIPEKDGGGYAMEDIGS